MYKTIGDGRKGKFIKTTSMPDSTPIETSVADDMRCGGNVGENVVIEDGTRMFHQENITLGNNVYIGHDCFLHGYHCGNIHIGNGSWIGPGCYMHGAGGIEIGENVGIGPHVKILTSRHRHKKTSVPVIQEQLKFGRIVIEDNCDIGVGAIILPGVHIGKGTVIGAGAIVEKDVRGYTIMRGCRERFIEDRKEE